MLDGVIARLITLIKITITNFAPRIALIVDVPRIFVLNVRFPPRLPLLGSQPQQPLPHALIHSTLGGALARLITLTKVIITLGASLIAMLVEIAPQTLVPNV